MYLLKLNNIPQISSKRFVVTPPIVSFDVLVMFLFVFQAFSLNFAIAHAQKRLLSELVIIVLHKSKKTLTNHLKQAKKSILSKRKFVNCLPLTITNREYQMFGNL